MATTRLKSAIRKTLFTAILISILSENTTFGQTSPESSPKIYVVSNAHLDTQWNWDIQTTIRDYVSKTLDRNLTLLELYPNYLFNFEGGVKYSWMKEYYPIQYAKVKEYIKNGRWHVSGSSWDATDALVPSPESAIRNILLGQEFYRNEFQVESTDIFLPDCFGFGWTLPTIASHCGLIGFSSQKLGWRKNPFYGKNKYPFEIGLWKGIDGSSIMMAHGYNYNKRWNNIDLSKDKELIELSALAPLKTIYHYYGTGDTGGSPTIPSVRSVEKSINGDGPLQIICATSDQLFKDYLPYESHPELPVFDGELLMDLHGTGCYTSQAAMKLYNRQNEILGDAAERSAVCADWLNVTAYPSEKLTETWKRFIFHQFHDDLTGTSIPKAYEFSWNDELISLGQFSDVLTSSVRSVAGQLNTSTKGIPVVLYNALGFQANNLVEIVLDMPKLPKNIAVFDCRGNKVPSQLLSNQNGKISILMEASVPANGYAVYDIRTSNEKSKTQQNDYIQSDKLQFENSIYKITLAPNGDIISLIDKQCNKEIVKKGEAIRLALFTENQSNEWPAWEIHKETIDRAPISIGDEQTEISLIENGTLRKTICIKKKYEKSVFKQYIHLYEGIMAHRIDFRNEIDWESENALLKAEFPLNINNQKATYDLGIGSIMRGNNKDTAYEVYAQYWADLTDHDNSYGVSILNDSKYGWDKPNDHTLRLTLLHTPKTKKRYEYQRYQDFGHHEFTYSLIGHSGALNKIETVQQAELLNQKIKAFQTSKHRGTLGREFSFAQSNNPNVLIKALKKAESSNEYVVRVYEISGKEKQNATLSFAGDIITACEADGTEKRIGNASFENNNLHLMIKPFSIKTFKVSLKPNATKPCDIKSEYLSLKFDRKCASWNAFRNDANFESQNSYAAELWPDSLIVNRVPFLLGEKDIENGMTCKGDTIQLPAGKNYDYLYLLAASTDTDQTATFTVGKTKQIVTVPYYTGFIGQWGHLNHTKGYLKPVEIAHIGTHRHTVNEDLPYEFTYMFKIKLEIPKGATEIVLPQNEKIVLFAATAVQDELPEIQITSQLYQTAIKE